MIRFESVSKKYYTEKDDVTALDNVSLQIAEGEFVAIRGPSGCGKSTLLALAGALTRPTSGKVIVAGQTLSELSAAQGADFRMKNIGFVFQMFHLLPYLSVRDNILMAASPDGRDNAEKRTDELLEQLHMSSRATHRPAELSAGERQRTAIARAMLNSPPILLADEPTGNLDPENATILLEFLKQFNTAGGVVLLVTHDDHSAGYATRTLHLREGRIETTE